MKRVWDSHASTQVGAGIRNVRKAQQRSLRDITSNLKHRHLEGAVKDVKNSVRDATESVGTYLGVYNPTAKLVDDENEVWLFDNTAYLVKGKWNAEFVVAYFKKGGIDVSGLMANVAEKLASLGTGKPDVRSDRISLFTTPIAPARWINVTSSSIPAMELGPSTSNGISNNSHILEKRGGTSIEISALDPKLTPYGSMSTEFADPKGWLVISDIDDSIKVTFTSQQLGLLECTFVTEPPQVIPGMPELYQTIHNTLHPNWFYLSASPYNLYPFLRKFIHAHYPKGTIFLRNNSWMNLQGLIADIEDLTKDPTGYKQEQIRKIHSWLPDRKVICIGDSTITDPEAYGAMYKAFKAQGWISKIFIRKVTNVWQTDNDQYKNSQERFDAAFKDVPPEDYMIFETEKPEDMHKVAAKVKALKGAESTASSLPTPPVVSA